MAADLASAAGLDPAQRDWLAGAAALDARVWQEQLGVARDISGLMAERNILRHLPVPVMIRWESGPIEHLLRTVMAGVRAGAPLTVSAARELPAGVGLLVAEDADLEEDVDLEVHVEDAAAFRARAVQLTGLPPAAPGAGDPRIRLVLDWSDAGAEASRAEVLALHEALDGSPDVAVYSGPVVSAADVELLPYLHEQAISITAHRFGTPDHLTDHLI